MLSMALGIAFLFSLLLVCTYGFVRFVESTDESLDNVDPAERLRDRYAAGELSDDEFDYRLDQLLDSESLSEELEPGMKR
ncbi:MAG: hypothetical protein IH933_02455 [Euryarchaeota archaeon]|nr:hypothetical protein [Euryarchaeota archaeon]